MGRRGCQLTIPRLRRGSVARESWSGNDWLGSGGPQVFGCSGVQGGRVQAVAEPDDVGPHELAAVTAGQTAGLDLGQRDGDRKRKGDPAADAANFHEAAVELEELPAPGALVEVVDVLGDEQEVVVMPFH